MNKVQQNEIYLDFDTFDTIKLLSKNKKHYKRMVLLE